MKTLTILHGLIASTALLLACYIQDPLFLTIRQHGSVLLVLLSLLGILISCCLSRWHKALMLLWLGTFSVVCGESYGLYQQKQQILNAHASESQQLRRLGRHLIIGYDQPSDVNELVRRGYIAGLFITAKNIQGKTFAQVQQEIAALQALRRKAGLPDLIIASDQEGGTVSRLSPLLPQQASLATLVAQNHALDTLEQHAWNYGLTQGRALASLGVNTNFSPVIDLKPESHQNILDVHTRIIDRAISSDPIVVSRVANAYSRGLQAQGVMPTLKHFPGLGSVSEDTHLLSGHLKLSRAKLQQRDWYPFRDLLSQTPAFLMVGHVIVDAIDQQNPASISELVLNGIIRQQWQHQGVLISDDMSMGAVYYRGLCKASVQALNASMDLLLVSYDWQKVYPLLSCLRQADTQQQLTHLWQSDKRLTQARNLFTTKTVSPIEPQASHLAEQI